MIDSILWGLFENQHRLRFTRTHLDPEYWYQDGTGRKVNLYEAKGLLKDIPFEPCYLNELRNCFQTDGWTTERELVMLYESARDAIGTIVEIGTCQLPHPAYARMGLEE